MKEVALYPCLLHGFIDLPLIDFFQIHLFLNPIAPRKVGGDGRINPGVIKHWTQLFRNKVDKEFRVKLLQLQLKILFAVFTQLLAQQIALRRAWSSSTRVRSSSGICVRCHAHSARPAARASDAWAAARTALIA